MLVLPSTVALSTAEVYAEADRLGLARSAAELGERKGELRSGLSHGEALPAATELLHNDLQRAAVSLCPEIASQLRRLREVGADVELVSGSGPTVIGLFVNPGRAELAAEALAGEGPAPICATLVGEGFGTSAAGERHLRA